MATRIEKNDVLFTSWEEPHTIKVGFFVERSVALYPCRYMLLIHNLDVAKEEMSIS